MLLLRLFAFSFFVFSLDSRYEVIIQQAKEEQKWRTRVFSSEKEIKLLKYRAKKAKRN